MSDGVVDTIGLLFYVKVGMNLGMDGDGSILGHILQLTIKVVHDGEIAKLILLELEVDTSILGERVALPSLQAGMVEGFQEVLEVLDILLLSKLETKTPVSLGIKGSLVDAVGGEGAGKDELDLSLGGGGEEFGRGHANLVLLDVVVGLAVFQDNSRSHD